MNEERCQALRLLKTARGQLDGIIKMIEEERYCIDISNQILPRRKPHLIILPLISHTISALMASG